MFRSFIFGFRFFEGHFHQILAGTLLALASFCAATAPDPNNLRQRVSAGFGFERIALLNEWLATINEAKSYSDDIRLRKINDFINRRIGFDDDILVWQQSNYWATPLETIGQRRGDCEDLAIIKYVSLRQAGVPAGKLRLVYVKARLDTPAGTTQRAHMVLAYYATPLADPLVLDNLDLRIRPATQRADLQPVFSFNDQSIFAGASGKDPATPGGLGRFSRWEDVLRRIRAEGFLLY